MAKSHRDLGLLLILTFFHNTFAATDTLHYMEIGQPVENAKPVHFMKPGDSVENVRPGLHIFCHQADSKYLFDMWKTQTMNLQTNLDSYDLYDGENPSEVDEKYRNNQYSFNWLGTKKSKQLPINPFKDTCIGVYTRLPNEFHYRMSMTQLRVDSWGVALTLVGIIIFLTAPKLSQNALFYYICGISFGVTTSAIILIWFASKLILPRGKFMYLMVATGWTMSFYLATALWDNAQIIVLQYRDWLTWYILITSFISFVICYRFGPVTNVRTKKIIQWILQAFGLLLIYYSSCFREASIGCCVLLIILYNLPTVFINKGKKYWKTWFPERRRLLSENEYRKEGIRETKKALSHLREFCSSPDCNQWKTVLRLKDPIRFAKFMEGEEHLLDNETNEHDSELTRLIEECEYTDDEDDDDLIEDY